jgi:hypothetical protein
MPSGHMTLKPLAEGEAPAGWAHQVINRYGNRGMGISLKHGPRPPSPDDLGIPRGTKAWRDQWNVENDWIGKQIFAGATLGDMGFDPNDRENFPIYQRLREGKFGAFRPDWKAGAQGHGRAFVDFRTGQLTHVPGSGSPGGGGDPGSDPNDPNGVSGNAFRAPQQGFRNTAIPTPAMGAQGTAPTPYLPTTALAGSPVSSQDSYMQNPRGGKKGGLRSLATLIRRTPSG